MVSAIGPANNRNQLLDGFEFVNDFAIAAFQTVPTHACFAESARRGNFFHGNLLPELRVDTSEHFGRRTANRALLHAGMIACSARGDSMSEAEVIWPLLVSRG